jgi:hypothetical protein
LLVSIELSCILYPNVTVLQAARALTTPTTPKDTPKDTPNAKTTPGSGGRRRHGRRKSSGTKNKVRSTDDDVMKISALCDSAKIGKNSMTLL